MQEFTITPGLNHESMKWFAAKATAAMSPDDVASRICPISRTDPELSRSPATVVVLAELDPLRDCGLKYADRLMQAGVKVQSYLVKGVPHGFFGMVDTYKTKTKEAYAPIVNFIKQFH